MITYYRKIIFPIKHEISQKGHKIKNKRKTNLELCDYYVSAIKLKHLI